MAPGSPWTIAFVIEQDLPYGTHKPGGPFKPGACEPILSCGHQALGGGTPGIGYRLYPSYRWGRPGADIQAQAPKEGLEEILGAVCRSPNVV